MQMQSFYFFANNSKGISYTITIKKIPENQESFKLLPAVGLEPTRCCHQQILSLPRLPIPTCRREQILY